MKFVKFKIDFSTCVKITHNCAGPEESDFVYFFLRCILPAGWIPQFLIPAKTISMFQHSNSFIWNSGTLPAKCVNAVSKIEVIFSGCNQYWRCDNGGTLLMSMNEREYEVHSTGYYIHTEKWGQAQPFLLGRSFAIQNQTVEPMKEWHPILSMNWRKMSSFVCKYRLSTSRMLDKKCHSLHSISRMKQLLFYLAK